MKVIRARNVHQALPEAIRQLKLEGVARDSRNGPVLVFPEPVTTVYERPAERVLFWAERDANPFFHLVESLWMLGGRNDVEFVARYVERMRSFSDDGVTFHGAYGWRWRKHFLFDQLPVIIDALKKDPTDRRQVLSMWDARADLGRLGKDLPCNLQAIFQIAPDGRLDMTVTNRSNDIIWGAYGANAVHFSYLHEYVARGVGVEQGIYRQVSANFHAYTEVLKTMEILAEHANFDVPGMTVMDPYAWRKGMPEVEPYPLISTDLEQWRDDLEMFMDNPTAMGLRDPFFRRVAVPMMLAHAAFKKTGQGEIRFDEAQQHLDNVKATDWQLAGKEWIERRRRAYLERQAKANDNGVAYE